MDTDEVCELHNASPHETRKIRIKMNTSATRYVGLTALEYDRNRSTGLLNRLRWKSEMNTMRGILGGFPPRQRLMDIPCGTGRFFPVLFENGHSVTGVDISADMIRSIPREYLSQYGDRLRLQTGDATSLDFEDNAVDHIVSLRLFNLITGDIRWKILREFRRVGEKGAVIQIRFRGPLEIADIRWTDLIRGAAHLGCWHLARLFGRKSPRPVMHRRIPRPSYQEFRRMTEAAGFTITACHRLFWGLTLSPMTLCVLEPV